MVFSFSDVEHALAVAHHIAPAKRSAFANRLKHLQRIGFPPGINTGRGRAADYQAEHVVLLALALELISFGYTPERAVKAIMDSLPALADGLGRASNPDTMGETIVCNFAPQGLAELKTPSDPGAYPRGPLSCMTGAEAASGVEYVTNSPAVGARIAMFSLSGLVNFAARLLQRDETEDEIHSFYGRLSEWAEGCANGNP